MYSSPLANGWKMMTSIAGRVARFPKCEELLVYLGVLVATNATWLVPTMCAHTTYMHASCMPRLGMHLFANVISFSRVVLSNL